LAAAAAAISTISSCLPAGTIIRVHAVQVCPPLMYVFATPFFTAAARSASSRITLADLPPSSKATRLTVFAAAVVTSLPARVEPVKDTMSTPGCADKASPTTGPVPCTRFTTPAGTPAASITAMNNPAVNGLISLGLSTTVLPAASAGTTLATIWCSG
jgi:hypothetical protein